MSLVESRHIAACRSIDPNYGKGENAINSAQKGFDVTGVEYPKAAIEKHEGEQ